MDYSNCVFASEANVREEVKRQALALKLGLQADPNKPLLMTMIEKASE